jgi:hypothetical protein
MLLGLNAAAKLREAAVVLGELRVAILDQVVVKDRSWTELARLLRCSDKTAVQRAIEAVIALSDWRCGRTVAAAPGVRFRNQPGSL